MPELKARQLPALLFGVHGSGSAEDTSVLVCNKHFEPQGQPATITYIPKASEGGKALAARTLEVSYEDDNAILEQIRSFLASLQQEEYPLSEEELTLQHLGVVADPAMLSDRLRPLHKSMRKTIYKTLERGYGDIWQAYDLNPRTEQMPFEFSEAEAAVMEEVEAAPAALPLRTTLAGYNLDAGLIDDMVEALFRKRGTPPQENSLTPETISAAYARISRNPANVGELRNIARHEVDKARRSNENIVFGLGHSSVAEHASFNVDVVGLSRLGVEAVERHRLASFTEKSQRYIKLDGDIVLPPEIARLNFESEFKELINRQNAAYFELHPALVDYFIPICEEAGEKKPERAAKSFASEDARYVVSLATQAQFGMTLNARTLEGMIRDALAHPLEEIREFGKQLRGEVHGIAPSLVKYVEATEYETAQFRRSSYWAEESEASGSSVRLLDHSEEPESTVLTAMVMNGRGLSWYQARAAVQGMNPSSRRELLEKTLEPGQPWDPPPREFELADFTFELVLSAAAFGQLKRHRMSTQITGPYDPKLGWTVPDSIAATNGQALFDEVMEASAALAGKIAEENPAAAAYALTNAHRRRVIFKANARELYHISRLREDQHAQWDIRRLTAEMVGQARAVTPLLLTLAVGKHEFKKRRGEIFGDREDA